MLLDGIPIYTLTPSALLGICVVMILTGRLVPRRTYDDQVERANQWMAESRIKDQQIHELSEQNNAMLHEFGPTVTAFMDALREDKRFHHHHDDHDHDGGVASA